MVLIWRPANTTMYFGVPVNGLLGSWVTRFVPLLWHSYPKAIMPPLPTQ